MTVLVAERGIIEVATVRFWFDKDFVFGDAVLVGESLFLRPVRPDQAESQDHATAVISFLKPCVSAS
jgi:hypothetical protein